MKVGILVHHKSPHIVRFSNKDGTFTTSDEEIVNVLSKTFHDVNNRNVSIDWSVLKEIKKTPVLYQINNPLTRNEFNQVIKKNLHIAPGFIKLLNGENRNVLFQICSDCFESDVEIEDR